MTLQTYTFLFTDIAGSTRLWAERAQEMGRAIERHNAIMRAAIEVHAGRVFKTAGDAFYAILESPEQAVQAALAAQRSLAAEEWGLPNGLWVRMAVHMGEAEEQAGDYFGPGANTTARLLGEALGGQVILSGQAVDAAGGRLPDGVTLQDLKEIGLKGIPTPVHVFRLIIPGVPVPVLDRFQVQVGSVVLSCEPYRWPRHGLELLELHVTDESGPLYESEADSLEEYFNAARGSIYRTLGGVYQVEYMGGGGPPVLVTDFRGHVGRFAFKPNDGVDLMEMRDLPGRFVGHVRLVPMD